MMQLESKNERRADQMPAAVFKQRLLLDQTHVVHRSNPGTRSLPDVEVAERVAYLTAIGKPLPVPGEAPEELFSSTAKVDAEAALARDFFTRVLMMDYDQVYLNDATQLEEFGDYDVLRRKILAVYSLNIGAELERPLWQVFKAIRASSR